jgi:hypothetical protein
VSHINPYEHRLDIKIKQPDEVKFNFQSFDSIWSLGWDWIRVQQQTPRSTTSQLVRRRSTTVTFSSLLVLVFPITDIDNDNDRVRWEWRTRKKKFSIKENNPERNQTRTSNRFFTMWHNTV